MTGARVPATWGVRARPSSLRCRHRDGASRPGGFECVGTIGRLPPQGVNSVAWRRVRCAVMLVVVDEEPALVASSTPLKSVYFFTRRVHTVLEGNKNKHGGGDTHYNMGFAWYVWDKSHRGRATFDFAFPQRPVISRLGLRAASRPQIKVAAV